MNQLSPDSLESQLQKIQQQAKIAEQLLFSKNAEVQAAQRKLDTLREKFAKETAQLLEKQYVSIQSARKSLEAEIATQNVILTELIQAVITAKAEKSRIDDLISSAKGELVSVADTIDTEKSNLELVKEQREGASHVVTLLKGDKLDLELSISKLKTEETSQISVLLDLNDSIHITEQTVADLDVEYETKSSEKEAQQVLLDAKLLVSRQELEKNQQEDTIIRDALAKWQKTLEERDTNLRIRERKVEQGESKLIQNSELLNL